MEKNIEEDIKQKIWIIMKGCKNKFCFYKDCNNFIDNIDKGFTENEKKEKLTIYLEKCKNNEVSICNENNYLENDIIKKYPFIVNFCSLSSLLSYFLNDDETINYEKLSLINDKILNIDDDTFTSIFTLIDYNLKNDLDNLENIIKENKLDSINKYLNKLRILLFFNNFLFDSNNTEIFKNLTNIFILLCKINENKNEFENLDSLSKEFFENKLEFTQNNLMLNYYNDSENDSIQKGLLCSINILYNINIIKKIFDNKIFINEALNEELELKPHILKYYQNKVKKISNVDSYLYHIYLFEIVKKVEILHYENLIEQNMNITNNLFNLNNIFNLGNFFLTINVRRENILQDALNQLNLKAKGKNLKSQLKVNFIGEQGIDDGGLKKEFFYLLIDKLFDPNFGMFLLKNDERVFWFNQFSFECNLNFELIGILLGIALYNSVVLDLKLPLAIYKKLMNINPNLKDLEEIDPQLYFTLSNIKKANKLEIENMDLDFTLEIENYGVINKIEIVPNGSIKKLTFENKDFYVEKYLNWFFNTSIFSQFNPFYNGFKTVLNSDLFNKFEPEDIMKAIIGTSDLNFEDLKKTSKYTDGYDENHRIIKEFWEVLESYSEEDKRKFLKFLTGSDRAPIKGLNSINMVISRASPDSENLPSAHTCYNHLLIPEYSDKEKLTSKLRQSIENYEGFGLI